MCPSMLVPTYNIYTHIVSFMHIDKRMYTCWQPYIDLCRHNCLCLWISTFIYIHCCLLVRPPARSACGTRTSVLGQNRLDVWSEATFLNDKSSCAILTRNGGAQAKYWPNNNRRKRHHREGARRIDQSLWVRQQQRPRLVAAKGNNAPTRLNYLLKTYKSAWMGAPWASVKKPFHRYLIQGWASVLRTVLISTFCCKEKRATASLAISLTSLY